jgi:hypothetical protein
MRVNITSWLAICLILLFRFVSTAAAQEPPPLSQPSQLQQQQQHLKLSAAVWTAAVVSDHVTTFQFRTKYPALLHEENMLVRHLENHPAWLVGVNAAIDASTGWAVYKFLGNRHPRLATLAFYGAAAYRTYLSVHNVRMMEKARFVTLGRP